MKRKKLLAFLLAATMVLSTGMNVRAAAYDGFSFEDSSKININSTIATTNGEARGTITADDPDTSTQTANAQGATEYVTNTVRGGVIELGGMVNGSTNTIGDMGKMAIQGVMAPDNSYTLSLWYKCKNTTPTNADYAAKPITLLGQNNGVNNVGTLVLNICKNEEGEYYYTSAIGGTEVSSTQTFDSLSEWQHVTIVYNNAATNGDTSVKDSVTFYINGVNAGSVEMDSSSNVVVKERGTNLIVGCNQNYMNGTDVASNGNNSTRWFTGYVDDVRIYKSAISEEEAQAIYNDTKHSCAVAVTSRDTSGNAGVATVSGGGVCAYGETVTVTAPETVGYKFIGWYKEGSQEMISDEMTATISINEEETPTMTVVAVYEAVGTATLTVADGVTVSGVTENEQGVYEANVGTSVTVSYNNMNNDFLYWKNASGKKLSSNAIYKFPLVSNISLEPVVKGTAGSSVLVEFVNNSNQVLSVSTWKESVQTMPTVNPYQLGYKFTGWVLKDTNTVLESADAIWDAVKSFEQATLVPVFTKVEAEMPKCRVTYSLNGTDFVDPEEVTMGTHKTLEAAEVEGQKFQYWVDGENENNILSYNKSYTFLVTKDITIKAVFAEEEIEAKPTIGMTGQYAITEDGTANSNVVKIAFAATRDIPTGYTLIEHGMLYTRDNEDEALFVEGAENVYKCTASKTQSQGTLTVNIPVKDAVTNIKAKAYIIVQKNGETGYETIYSNVATYDLKTQQN